MQNHKLKIVAFFFFLLLALSSKVVFADNTTSTLPTTQAPSSISTTSPAGIQNSPVFSFTFGQQNFKVASSDISQWQSAQIVGQEKILAVPAQKFKDSLLAFIGTPPATQNFTRYYNFSLSTIYNYIQTLAKTINTPLQETSLQIQDGRAVNFVPPQTGQAVDVYKSAFDTLTALSLQRNTVELSVNKIDPQVPLSQTNNLGINQLIAEGVSSFKGSPNNRRHNIAAGVEKFKGLIIPQGATFSFDDNLGPVTAEAGFVPELVIDNGTTLPELGGGLCQVSTTAFRAAMQAGLPITARRNHAYAVSYYSPQGTDATIYPGSADLKFVNDTPGAILIWPYEKDANTLVFDFYGTSDERQVTLEKPVVYDRTSDGAMKATWTRDVVSADGTKRQDVFKSNYQPPALFHKTETFVTATGTQVSNLVPIKTQ